MHPHNAARHTFLEQDGVTHPAPAPRFSRTPGALRRPPPAKGADTRDILIEWGFPADEVASLASAGVIA